MKKMYCSYALLIALFVCALFSCKKIPPQYVCDTPVKKITAYDSTGANSYVREYAYDQQARITSVSESRTGRHGPETIVIGVVYNANSSIHQVVINGTTADYAYINDTLRTISSTLFNVLQNPMYFLYRTPAHDRVPDIFVTPMGFKSTETSYFLHPGAPADVDSLVEGVYDRGPDEHRYLYTKSNLVNPEYAFFTASRLYHYYNHGYWALTAEPESSNKHLPSGIDHWRNDTHFPLGSFTYEKDKCGRVIKAWRTENGVKKLWKLYEYY